MADAAYLPHAGSQPVSHTATLARPLILQQAASRIESNTSQLHLTLELDEEALIPFPRKTLRQRRSFFISFQVSFFFCYLSPQWYPFGHGG